MHDHMPDDSLGRKSTLHRSDVENRVIKDILQGPWESLDEFSSCCCHVQLDNGVVFELAYGDPDLHRGLYRTEIEVLERLVALDWSKLGDDCRGDYIEKVVVCKSWPSIGIVTGSGLVVYCSDYGTPYQMGPLVQRLDDLYERNELWDLWDHCQHRVKE